MASPEASSTTVATPVAFWRTPAAGMAEAQTSGKLLLYDFSTEWWGPCNRLNAEVFENPNYKAQILEKFVPVHVVDRKHEDGKNPPEVQDLQEKYSIRAFPPSSSRNLAPEITPARRVMVARTVSCPFCTAQPTS